MSLSARPPLITTYSKTTNIYVLVTFCTDTFVSIVGNQAFQYWHPPRVGQTRPMIARKRAAFARIPVEPSMRGRPRRSARSTYASTPKDQVKEGPTVEYQPPASEEQQAPNPTPEQELQQLQAQLQSMRQERDRVAAALATNQRAAQTSAQVVASHPTGQDTKYAAFVI